MEKFDGSAPVEIPTVSRYERDPVQTKPSHWTVKPMNIHEMKKSLFFAIGMNREDIDGRNCWYEVHFAYPSAVREGGGANSAVHSG